MAKRILGMGDVVSLIETASKMKADEIEAETTERIARADLNLNDFLEMNKQIHNMGGIAKLVSALPGGDRAMSQGQVDMKALDRMEIIIHSMTKYERENPQCLNGSRRARIARGAGVTVTDVNQMMKKYNETRKMMKKMMPQMDAAMGKGKKGKKGKRRRLGGVPGMPGMSLSDMKKLQSMLEENM